MEALPILIVGAGPTGLVLALALARLHTPIRIIDAAAGPGEQSRALVVHARTVELFRQLGIADDVIDESVKFTVAHLRRQGLNGKPNEITRWSFETAGLGITPYPFILSYPQDYNERLLIRNLEALGINVEWNTSLKDFTQVPDKVVAEIITTNATETAEFSYICGCDGSHSAVRELLNMRFPGGTYTRLFFVADVKMENEFSDNIYFSVEANGFCLMMPVRVSGMHRLVGLIPDEVARKENISFEDVRAHVEGLIGSHVPQVNWFSPYHSSHRVAERFSCGRALLLGDAGHVHSPVGGQGMNTGIGDAMNLGWKLAAVHAGRASPAMLQTYEEERKPFAEKLVATTDRAFSFVTSNTMMGRFVRVYIFPFVAMIMSKIALARSIQFRIVSQTSISYRNSWLSTGKVGRLAAGDRLPWVNYGKTDNFEPLDGRSWQLHVYGDAYFELGELSRILVHHFPFTKDAKTAGFKEDSVFLVRPDGYIGLAMQKFDIAQLREYTERLGMIGE